MASSVLTAIAIAALVRVEKAVEGYSHDTSSVLTCGDARARRTTTMRSSRRRRTRGGQGGGVATSFHEGEQQRKPLSSSPVPTKAAGRVTRNIHHDDIASTQRPHGRRTAD
jgi:hypothetical protein